MGKMLPRTALVLLLATCLVQVAKVGIVYAFDLFSFSLCHTLCCVKNEQMRRCVHVYIVLFFWFAHALLNSIVL